MLGLLIDESVGLLDLECEGLPGSEELSDLLDWQLNKHTSDLWSLLSSNDQLHVVENEVTDLLLQVRVSLGGGRDELLSLECILLLWGHVGSIHHLGLWHWGTWSLGHWGLRHTWWWHHVVLHLSLWLRWSLLLHLLTSHLTCTHVHSAHVLSLMEVSSLVVSWS